MTTIIRQDGGIGITENRAKGTVLFNFLITVDKYLTRDNMQEEDHQAHSVRVQSRDFCASQGEEEGRSLRRNWGWATTWMLPLVHKTLLLLAHLKFKGSSTPKTVPLAEDQMLNMGVLWGGHLTSKLQQVAKEPPQVFHRAESLQVPSMGMLTVEENLNMGDLNFLLNFSINLRLLKNQ